MNSKEWFDLGLALTPIFALCIWLMVVMWRDNVRQTRRHEAILKQTAQQFQEKETDREVKK